MSRSWVAAIAFVPFLVSLPAAAQSPSSPPASTAAPAGAAPGTTPPATPASAGATTAATTSPASATGPAKVEVTSSQPNLSVHLQTTDKTLKAEGITPAAKTDDEGFAKLCAAPCSIQLPAGTYHFGVAEGSGSPVEVSKEITLSGPAQVDAHYESHFGVRLAGYITFFAGLGIGTGVALAGYNKYTDAFGYKHSDMKDIAIGATIAGVTTLASIVLWTFEDKATLTVSPMNMAMVPSLGFVPKQEGSDQLPRGLMFAGTF